MPKTTIEYRIFIASPSDVDDEKNAIKEIVNELNHQSLIKNIKLEVLDWKSSTYPSIGEDAQDVINSQINDDFDIFIGVFWSRFGAATKRDLSGTKEEFERAFARYVQNNKSVHIMMYFKTAAIDFDNIDPQQIASIKEFKTDISNRGVLFSNFNQLNEFQILVRGHLTKLLSNISNSIEDIIRDTPEEHSLIVLEKIKPNEDEMGYFEYIELANDNMFKMRDELTKLTKETSGLGKRLNRRTAKINALQGKPDAFIQKQSKKIISDAGDDLDIFSNNSAPIIPVINELFNTAMKSYSQAFLIHRDYIKNSEEQIQILELLKNLKDAMVFAYDGITSLNNSVSSFPPLTTKLLKAKNQANVVMLDITNHFSAFINVIEDVINLSFN